MTGFVKTLPAQENPMFPTLTVSRAHSAKLFVYVLLVALSGPERSSAQIMPPTLRAFAGIDTLPAAQARATFRQTAAVARGRRDTIQDQLNRIGNITDAQQAVQAMRDDVTRLLERVEDAQTRINQNTGTLNYLISTIIPQQVGDSTRLEQSIASVEASLAVLGPQSEGSDPNEAQRVPLARERDALRGQLQDANARLTSSRGEATGLSGTNTALAAERDNLRREATVKGQVVTLLQNQQLPQALEALRLQLNARTSEITEAERNAQNATAQITATLGKIRSGLRPVRDSEEAAAFYGEPNDLTAGRSAQLSLGTNGNGSVTADIARAFAGPVRLLLSGVVARKEDDTPDDGTEPGAEAAPPADPSDVRRFFAGGGNMVFSAAYPAWAWVPSRRATFVVEALGKWGFDVPGNDTTGGLVKRTSMNLDLGADAYFSWGLDTTDIFRFFGFGRAGWVLGTDPFYNGLGLADDQDPFIYTQFIGGLEIRNTMRLVFTHDSGPGPLADDWRFTVQLTPPAQVR
jgi:hypothetical protein